MAQEGRKPCPLYGTIKQQHEAIDQLFGMLIKADPKFKASTCGDPWEAAKAGAEIIRQLESHRCIEDEIKGGDEPNMGAPQEPTGVPFGGAIIGLGDPINISKEDVEAAIKAYPGWPTPLAITKYMLDKSFLGEKMGQLHAGTAWGGLHLERIGLMVQKVAQALYDQLTESVTIKISAEQFPESWDHISLEIVDVGKRLTDAEMHSPVENWPCCGCGEPIKGSDREAGMFQLRKVANWEYPTWGNLLQKSHGFALAVMCGKCIEAKKKPEYAIKKDGDQYVRVPLAELEDQ